LTEQPTSTTRKAIRKLLFGAPRDPHDKHIFHKLSLIAFFAWIGLGADGLSSSCYGPEEAYLALDGHHSLGIFVALASTITIIVLSASYSQIIELFPHGGGGYLVASKLLSPRLGMVSGCALLVDYVLTITISIASGADALFSFLPLAWTSHKFQVALGAIVVLTLLNLRGVKESILPLVPIFLAFVFTHVFFILFAIVQHAPSIPQLVSHTQADLRQLHGEKGLFGIIVLILTAYSMGAGTFTGIEAVSNGIPVLREPRVETAKRTMRYMGFSLAFTVLGLMIGYLLFNVQHVPGKTLNAVLFETVTAAWNRRTADTLVWITLISEAALLFIAAQTGFLDGPRVLASMALDRWFPTRFGMLSDRFVSGNGILLMGLAASAMMFLTGGAVKQLVILYSINVFVTFVLSQLGMVRHWWMERSRVRDWGRRFAINGTALIMTSFILVAVIVLKFHDGGYITLIVTGGLVVLAFVIHRHYEHTRTMLNRLDELVRTAEMPGGKSIVGGPTDGKIPACDFHAKTAILLVNGFNGLGLHTVLNIFRLFGGTFKNFVFVEIGLVDAGVFKGSEEIEHLQKKVGADLDRYTRFMNRHGYYAEGVSAIGTDVAEEIGNLAPSILERFPHSVLFGGQLVFPRETTLTRLLHNYTIFSLQRRFYYRGVPLVILPIRV